MIRGSLDNVITVSMEYCLRFPRQTSLRPTQILIFSKEKQIELFHIILIFDITELLRERAKSTARTD